MDEAAMEGAVGGGGGHGLASGAAHASYLDVLRDSPGAAASRAAPGRHDREAARARPARPAGTLARHHAPPTDGDRRTASGARCVGAQAARSGARSADHASLHQYHRTPQPARVTVSMRRSRPPTGHRRAADGDATTTAPPLPDRREEGGF